MDTHVLSQQEDAMRTLQKILSSIAIGITLFIGPDARAEDVTKLFMNFTPTDSWVHTEDEGWSRNFIDTRDGKKSEIIIRVFSDEGKHRFKAIRPCKNPKKNDLTTWIDGRATTLRITCDGTPVAGEAPSFFMELIGETGIIEVKAMIIGTQPPRGGRSFAKRTS